MKDSRIGLAMGVCKKVVSTFSYSWKKKKELTKAQRELKLPEHSLKMGKRIEDNMNFMFHLNEW
jgi:hypothetical protein